MVGNRRGMGQVYTRRAPVGRGFLHPRYPEQRLVTVAFDAETLDQLRTRAMRAQISLMEQVRLLVEHGLEDAPANGAAAGEARSADPGPD